MKGYLGKTKKTFWENFFKIKGLFHKPFVRNVIILVSGTALAQLISIIFSPLITRIYGPDAFGLLGIFTALISMVSPIAGLTYPIAMVLPKRDSDAIGIAKLSLFVALFISSIVAVFLITGGKTFLQLLDSEAIAPYILLIPISIFFAACLEVGSQWLIRKKQFRVTARIGVIQALVLGSAKVGLGFFFPGGATLVILAALGQVIHLIMLWTGINVSLRQMNLDVEEQQDPVSLKVLAKRHIDFPLFRAPQVFINTISQNLPVLLLANFFGPAAAGFYSLGRRVLGMPVHLVSQSVGNVFYPRITEAAHNGENLALLIIKATAALAAVGFVPFFVITAYGPGLFSFVFGSEWLKAGEYARWLAMWLFFQFLNRPCVVAIPVLKLQKSLLLYEVFSTGAKILGLVLGFFYFSDDVMAVALFSMFGIVAYAYLILWVIRKSIVFEKGQRGRSFV